MFSFDESTEISARFHRKVLRKDFFTKITFHKNVHADFYGYLDVNFVVSVLTPTNIFRGLSDIDSVVTDFDPNNDLVGDPKASDYNHPQEFADLEVCYPAECFCFDPFVEVVSDYQKEDLLARRHREFSYYVHAPLSEGLW